MHDVLDTAGNVSPLPAPQVRKEALMYLCRRLALVRLARISAATIKNAVFKIKPAARG